MLKPVVVTWTAHAMMAPAAIRMRLTPRPICQPPARVPRKGTCSLSACDRNELEVSADLPEQPVEAGHERRFAPLAGQRRRLAAERPKDEGFTDFLEFVHGLFSTRS